MVLTKLWSKHLTSFINILLLVHILEEKRQRSIPEFVNEYGVNLGRMILQVLELVYISTIVILECGYSENSKCTSLFKFHLV